jgi:hypothetical protein
MTYELSDAEVEFTTKAMIHSANINITFYDQGADGYGYEETKKLADETNRIIYDVFKYKKT